MKSLEKTRQVRENWSQQLEHKQVPKRGRNHVSGRVSIAGMPQPLQMFDRDHTKFSDGQAWYQGHELAKSLIGW